jgi:hypothetical protein
MVSETNLHEDLSRQEQVEKSSERALGITFGVVCLVLGAILLYAGSRWWILSLALAVLFVLLAYFWVAPLRPLNSLWHRFGLLLFHVVNPLVMGVIFYSTIFPIGLLMRLFGKDPLRLKLDREAKSYWQMRVPSAGVPQNMRNQF